MKTDIVRYRAISVQHPECALVQEIGRFRGCKENNPIPVIGYTQRDAEDKLRAIKDIHLSNGNEVIRYTIDTLVVGVEYE